jgi:hypothetical protein
MAQLARGIRDRRSDQHHRGTDQFSRNEFLTSESVLPHSHRLHFL